MVLKEKVSGRQARQVLALALMACVLVACGKQASQTEQAASDAAPASEAPQAMAARAVSAEVAAMGVDQLREAAQAALREQRLYAPAGNNAMEYYVALRDKAPSDAAVASALTDLMPYTLIATEQSIAREDLPEAQRLYGLIERADANAPALPRLKQSIADAQAALAQRTAAAEAKTEEDARRLAEQQKQQAAAAATTQAPAATPTPPPATSAPAAPAAAPASSSRPQTTKADEAPAQAAAEEKKDAPAAKPAAPAPAEPAPAKAVGLRAVRTPSPVYPMDALRAGLSGEVIVEFTVDPDGSVSNARVVRATPPRTFDRAALNAVRRWQFEPIAVTTTSRRTIEFKP